MKWKEGLGPTKNFGVNPVLQVPLRVWHIFLHKFFSCTTLNFLSLS